MSFCAIERTGSILRVHSVSIATEMRTNTQYPRGKRRRGGKKTVAPRNASRLKTGNGEVERLERYCLRAHQLKSEGLYVYEIAPIIATEFELPRIPPVTTVWYWLNRASEAYQMDIAKLKLGEFEETYDHYKGLLAKWMPIATAGSLEIQRWQRIEGELQPFLDEDSMSEQLKASMVVVKALEGIAKLLGLNIDSKLDEKSGALPTLAEMNLWIISTINQSVKPLDANVEKPVLELRSGSPEIDRMESGAA
jgi:hypothetical protein